MLVAEQLPVVQLAVHTAGQLVAHTGQLEVLGIADQLKVEHTVGQLVVVHTVGQLVLHTADQLVVDTVEQLVVGDVASVDIVPGAQESAGASSDDLRDIAKRVIGSVAEICGPDRDAIVESIQTARSSSTRAPIR